LKKLASMLSSINYVLPGARDQSLHEDLIEDIKTSTNNFIACNLSLLFSRVARVVSSHKISNDRHSLQEMKSFVNFLMFSLWS